MIISIGWESFWQNSTSIYKNSPQSGYKENICCSCLVTKSCSTLLWPPWTIAHLFPVPGKYIGVSHRFLLQGIFPNYGLNLCLLHWKVNSLPPEVNFWVTRETLEKIYLSIIKTIFDNPTANIILNGEKLKAPPLRSGTKQRCPLSLILFYIILEIAATGIG